jgi:DNA-binding NarL/FixJ family response regulator
VERTVELHVTALLDRFDVDNRSALVVKVLTALS